MGIEQLTFIKDDGELTLDFKNKVEIAIERLKIFEPPEGYYLADSYGKDSCTTRQLLIMAKVKYDGHYHRTGIDPPEAIRFGREYHPEVDHNKPTNSFWRYWYPFGTHGFPTRVRRWCCAELKENGGYGRLVVTGVRWDESGKRKNRQMIEVCNKSNMGGKRFMNPIIDWTDEDVWQFIDQYQVPVCDLYKQGYKRIGCILCPMKDPTMDLERYPGFVNLWRMAFNRLYDARKADNNPSVDRWESGDEMFDWWLTRKGDTEEQSSQCFFFE